MNKPPANGGAAICVMLSTNFRRRRGLMATRKISLELRRLSRSYHSLRPLQSCLLSNPNFPPAPTRPGIPTTSKLDPSNQLNTLISFPTSLRYFSSRSEPEFSNSSHSLSSVTESELESILTDASGIPVPDLGDVIGNCDYILPIRATISMLDWIHDSTGLPWWITIVFSTLMLRLSLFPVRVLQLHKLTRIAECARQLPPLFPPPFSGKSYVKHFSNFQMQRKAIGCPSYSWFLAYFFVQVPCFVLWMASIRSMSEDHHAGFDTGGILWFYNLTGYAHGASGLIFPTLIAGLHFLQLKITFQSSKVGKQTGSFELFAKYFEMYMKALTVPIFGMGFLLPHGSLVYWVSSSSLNIIQHLCLQNPNIREKLGLPREKVVLSPKNPESFPDSRTSSEALNTSKKIPVKDLSPKELLSVLSLSRENGDKALFFLRLALDKDPEYVRALTVMGQTLLQKRQEEDAVEYFERAIAKLTRTGMPAEVEEVDLLIQASQWAGVGYIRQGKMIEGKVHLERVASLEEPEDIKSKVHYYDGIVMLASTLLNEGRKAEAIAYLEKAAAYNPDYNEYLEQCKNE
ncbi:hypothetical protein V2J09_023128 [Rumex salicifolius]